MPVNRKALGEAERRLRHQSTRAANELRSLRLRAGLSQAAVAREVGIARSVVTRLEAGDPGITLRTRFRIAAVLGADLRMTAYAESGPLIRDAAQATILEELLTLIDPRWRQTPEEAVPGPGRRSIDLRLDGPGATVLVEIESHVGSLEEIIRELHSKRQALAEADRDGSHRPIHIVLCLLRTRHHLAILRAHPRTIVAAFPASSAELLTTLADCSKPWPGDGLLLIDVPRPVAGKRQARISRTVAGS